MTGKFVKHEKNIDVCFEVIGHDGLEVFLYAWNMGQVACFEIGETIRLPEIKLREPGWMICTNPDDILNNNKSFREASWVYLNG